MTSKPFSELQVGDFVCDMHDGLGPVRERFDVVSHVNWDEPDQNDAPLFNTYIGQFRSSRGYVNKHLVVIGFSGESTLSRPVVIAAYCYDGRRSGIVVFCDKQPTMKRLDIFQLGVSPGEARIDEGASW